MHNPKLPNIQMVLLPTVYSASAYEIIGGTCFNSAQCVGK